MDECKPLALGTSLLTQSLGLSMALGAFLAGLLLAETVGGGYFVKFGVFRLEPAVSHACHMLGVARHPTRFAPSFLEFDGAL